MKKIKFDDYMKLIDNIIENEFIHVQDEALKGMDELDEYNKIRKEANSIQLKLCELLPSEYHQLVEDWDAKIWEGFCIEMRHYFKKGVVAGTSNLSFIRDITEGYKFY